MESRTRSRLASGLLLILLGLGLYGLQYFEDLGRSLILMLAGALFVGSYLMTRSAFQVTLGSLLLGIGLGSFGKESEWYVVGRFPMLALGIGFVLIWVIRLVYERRSQWWPLIPGTILILLGVRRWGSFWRYLLDDGWPLILVIVGVLVALGALGQARKQAGPAPRDGGTGP